jgi:hypothetical protein
MAPQLLDKVLVMTMELWLSQKLDICNNQVSIKINKNWQSLGSNMAEIFTLKLGLTGKATIEF